MSAVGTNPIPTNVWTHAAVTTPGTMTHADVSLYLGVGMAPLAVEAHGSGSANGLTSTLADGGVVLLSGFVSNINPFSNDTQLILTGALAYTAVWNRQLSHAELLQAQAFGPGSVPNGLTFYWSCGRDRGPFKLAPSLYKAFRPGAGDPFPATGGRVYEWSRTGFFCTVPDLQYLRPASDIAADGWLPSSGSDLYAMLDETSADDADYIYSPTNPTTQQFEVKLSAGEKPPLGSTMPINIRFRAMGQNTTFDIDLVENTTVQDSWSEALTVAEGAVERQHTVASAIVDDMTDFADLRIRGVARAP